MPAIARSRCGSAILVAALVLLASLPSRAALSSDDPLASEGRPADFCSFPDSSSQLATAMPTAAPSRLAAALAQSARPEGSPALRLAPAQAVPSDASTTGSPHRSHKKAWIVVGVIVGVAVVVALASGGGGGGGGGGY